MRVGVVHSAASPCGCAAAVVTGLSALGHEYVVVDAEEIFLRSGELAATCDLVIDHTDTFLGWGVLRPFVRWELERQGARIAGSSARTCFLADDKIAVRRRFAAAGIPVPPGVGIADPGAALPPWLEPPLILKPACEHMSRGIVRAATSAEAVAALADLVRRYHQPVLVETFIPGRELAVSLLEGPEGPVVLPILEWLPEGEEYGILTEEYKCRERDPDRDDARRPLLSPACRRELESLAGRAFRSLGLRDYARFDVRLAADGSCCFLEANTTPSLETAEALALSARWAGLDYPGLVAHILAAARRRYEAGNRAAFF